MQPQGGAAEQADFKRLAKIMGDAGYRGYIVLEYEEKEDPRSACPRYMDELRQAFSQSGSGLRGPVAASVRSRLHYCGIVSPASKSGMCGTSIPRAVANSIAWSCSSMIMSRSTSASGEFVQRFCLVNSRPVVGDRFDFVVEIEPQHIFCDFRGLDWFRRHGRHAAEVIDLLGRFSGHALALRRRGSPALGQSS